LSGGRALRLAALAYGVLTAAGVAWMALRGDALLEVLLARRVAPWTALLIGAVAAVAIVLLSDLVLERFAWPDLLRREVLSLLGPLTRARIAALAALSAVGEELFFRGALVPAIGLVPAAVLFGLLHGVPDPRLLGWALFAAAAGLLFGALFLWTGGLLAPIVCHAAVNAIQLGRLRRGGCTGRARVDRLHDL
jgi:membrane protease YdiL (CAAX protease family)